MKPAELDGAKLASKPAAARGKAKTASPVQEPTYTHRTLSCCRAYAVVQLSVTQENEHFLGGMQPFDSDSLITRFMESLLPVRDSLECHEPVEFDYYNSR